MRAYPSLTMAVEGMMAGLRLPQDVCADKEPNRRYGMLFTNIPDLAACMLGDEPNDRSSWEYKASASPVPSPTYERFGPSPAQEIARGCRSAWSSELADSDESDTSAYSSDEVSDSSIGNFGERIRCGQSRYEELTLVEQEAHAEMMRCRANPGQLLVCPRPGCRDMLRDVKSLKYHLHLHLLLDDETFSCPQCSSRYPSRKDLTRHNCPSRAVKSAPSSPIMGSIIRVMSRLSVH